MDESTITAILSVLEIIISVALIVVILMQSKNASGLSGALGGMGLVISFLPDMYKSDTPQGAENENAISVDPNSDVGIDVVPNDGDNVDLEDGNAVPEANSAQ